MTPKTALLSLAATLCVAPVFGQVTTVPGMQQSAALPVNGATYASLSDGGYIGFDGMSITRHDSTGLLTQTYHTLGAPVFSSFVEVDEAESFAYVGESSNGDVFKVDLVAGTASTLFNANFNYDLAFDSSAPGFAYLSAALGGFGTGNDLLRVDLTTGTTTPVAHVAGPSGPVAVDDDGNLYYVTGYDGGGWPPPLEDEDLISWSAAQLAGGGVLSEADATYLVSDLDGSGSMLYDSVGDQLLLTHNNFQGFEIEILRFRTDGTPLGSLGGAFTHLGNIELVNGPGQGVCAPFQPENATLHVHNVDFGGGTDERVSLTSLRATASFSGPAGGASGPATVSFANAYPGGSVSVMLAPSSFLGGSEVEADLGWGAPTFFFVDLVDVWRRTQPLTADGNGGFQINYNQPAGWTGNYAFQAILYDDLGNPIGTSEFVIND